MTWKVELPNNKCSYYVGEQCHNSDNETAWRHLGGLCQKEFCPIKKESENK